MSSMRVGTMAALCVAAMAWSADAAFVPGHFYTPTDSGFVLEWNAQLQQVGQFSVPDLPFNSGAVFNSSGNLVIVGMRAGSTKVVEVDSRGTVLREYATGLSGFLDGAYIDFDAGTNRYVVADNHRITVLDQNLNYITSSVNNFSRASGVAFAPGNIILATDQGVSGLRRFDAMTMTELSPLSIGGAVRTGIDVGGSGDVLTTLFVNGAVQLLAGGNPPAANIVGGLGNGGASDVRWLPDGSFVTIGFRGNLRHFSSAGALIESGPVTDFSDGVAYFVPSPGASVLLAVFGASTARRRRR